MLPVFYSRFSRGPFFSFHQWSLYNFLDSTGTPKLNMKRLFATIEAHDHLCSYVLCSQIVGHGGHHHLWPFSGLEDPLCSRYRCYYYSPTNSDFMHNFSLNELNLNILFHFLSLVTKILVIRNL